MQMKTVTNCNVEPMKRRRLWSFGGVGLNSICVLMVPNLIKASLWQKVIFLTFLF